MTFDIRAARPADDARLRAIHLTATMSSYGRELTWLEPILGDPATPLEPADWTIVAEDAGRILGYAAVSRNHLENLFVDPAAQGRGVGAALLVEVESRVRAGFERVTLRCLLVNPQARRFYERYGYQVRETQTIVYHERTLVAWFLDKRLV